MTEPNEATTAPEQEPAPEPKNALIARLDANGIFQGTEEIDAAELTDAHVHLPNGCDLPTGKHRWDAAKRTFVALPEGGEVVQPDPHALRAVAIGFVSLHDAGLPLPPETLQWLDFYTASMDFMGGFSEETVAMVKRYWASRKGGK